MLWVIYCSRDEASAERFREKLTRQEVEGGVQAVPVVGAESMCAGYRRGTAAAGERGAGAADGIVFCHDDITFLRGDFLERVRRHLERFDGVGIAGTQRLGGAMWASANSYFLFGQVCHLDQQSRLEIGYGQTPGPIVGGMQGMDGVFLAFRRGCIEAVGWDAETFTGFHLYDVDTTYRAYRAGYRLAVACDLPLLHESKGNFGPEWQRWADVFQAKHQLSRNPPMNYTSPCGATVETERDVVEAMRPAYWEADREAEAAAAPRTVTVVVTTGNGAEFAAACERWRPQLAGVSATFVQAVAYHRAAAWNAAVDALESDALLFVTPDVRFLQADGVMRLLGRLERWEAVGITGTTRMAGPAWHQAGHPHLIGQYAYPMQSGEVGVVQYAAPRATVGNMEALDGPVWACRRSLAKGLRFDERTLTGMDVVETEFTFRAFLEGRRMAVACDVGIVRNPPAYGRDWREQGARFLEKLGKHFRPVSSRRFTFFGMRCGTVEEALEGMTLPRVE